MACELTLWSCAASSATPGTAMRADGHARSLVAKCSSAQWLWRWSTRPTASSSRARCDGWTWGSRTTSRPRAAPPAAPSSWPHESCPLSSSSGWSWRAVEARPSGVSRAPTARVAAAAAARRQRWAACSPHSARCPRRIGRVSGRSGWPRSSPPVVQTARRGLCSTFAQRYSRRLRLCSASPPLRWAWSTRSTSSKAGTGRWPRTSGSDEDGARRVTDSARGCFFFYLEHSTI
mmetsp:Transcript_24572/g.49864  ORF Transcript_24572/g.49864 Transcript_24572/m.49864 type:complete len:233 (-) Transcript_24572:184-882(-)